MYIAKRNFHSLYQGKKNIGDKVEYNATFEAEGLIEEVAEVKPEQTSKIETKPHKKGRK